MLARTEQALDHQGYRRQMVAFRSLWAAEGTKVTLAVSQKGCFVVDRALVISAVRG